MMFERQRGFGLWHLRAAILASCGFAALACGAGAEEGNASDVAVAGSASSNAPKATSHAMTGRASGSAAPTATTPTESPLPAPFNAANDARKSADATLATLLATKETSCDVIAAALAKFTTDNADAYSSWNTEYAKLSPEQMRLARSRAIGGPDLAASLGVGGFKACLDKKDPNLGMVMRSFLGMVTVGQEHK